MTRFAKNPQNGSVNFQGIKSKSEFDFPALAIHSAFQPAGIAGAVGKCAFDRIPIEAGIVHIAHIAKTAEDGRTRAGFRRTDRFFAADAAIDEVLFLQGTLVWEHSPMVEDILL